MISDFYGISEKELDSILFNIRRNRYLISKYFGVEVENLLFEIIHQKYNIKLEKEYIIDDILTNGKNSNSFVFLSEYYDGMFNRSIKDFFNDLKNGNFETLSIQMSGTFLSRVEEIERFFDENLRDAKLELYSINKQNFNDFISEFCSYVVNNANHDSPDPIFVENKNLLLSFLNMTILTQLNKEFSEAEKQKIVELFSESISPDFVRVNKIREFNNTEKAAGMTTQELLLSEITNAFSHNGEIYWNDNFNKIRIVNYGKAYTKDETGKPIVEEVVRLSVDLDTQYFNTVIEQITSLRSNGIIPIMKSISDKIKNDRIEDISKVEGISMMLYLLFNFNKESMLDEYIANQYALVDASKFRVKYGLIDASKFRIEDGKTSLEEKDYRNLQWIKNYLFKFADKKSEQSFDIEWKEVIESVYKNVDLFSGNPLVYDVERQPYATDIGKHIPTPELIRHLRNAVRHGNVYYIDGMFKFHDETKTHDKYFYMEIAEQDLTNFLDTDIFQEVINLSPIDNVSIKKSGTELYLSETSLSKNSFSDYIDILRYSFPDKSKEEILRYMYDNGMISRYLSDNPNRVNEFYSYLDGHGNRVIDYLKRYASCEDYDDSYLAKYNEYAMLNIEVREGLKKEFSMGEPGIYFISYFKTLKNLEKKRNFIKDDLDSEQLPEMDSMFVETKNVFKNLINSYEFDKMVTQAMMGLEGLSEIDKIYYSIYSSNDLDEKYGKSKKRKYTYKTSSKSVSNIEFVNEGRKKLIDICHKENVFLKNSSKFLINLISIGVLTIPMFLGNIEFVYNNIDFLHGLYMFNSSTFMQYYEFFKQKKNSSGLILDGINTDVNNGRVFGKGGK